MKSWAVLLILPFAASCADPLQSLSEPWHVVEEGGSDYTAPPASAEPGSATSIPVPSYTYEVVPVASPACEAESVVGVPDLTNAELRCAPRVHERFGEDGCLDERWIRACDEELLVAEDYELWEASLAYYAYVDPVPYSHRWDYDESQLLVEQTRTSSKGELMFQEDWAYDQAGRPIERNAYGAELYPSESRRLETWLWDEQGRLVEHVDRHNEDYVYSERHIFRSDGALLETWRIRGGAEFMELRNTYAGSQLVRTEFFDEIGHVSTTEHHNTADGRLERSVRTHHRNGWLDEWRFDEAGRETYHAQDEENDGSIEYLSEKQWDELGNLLQHRVRYDFDASGTARAGSLATATYDAEGRVVETRSQHQWHAPTTYRTRYAYDADGVTIVRDELGANDVVVARNDESRTSHDDRLLWRNSDVNGDGALERVEQRTYDADGRLLEAVQFGADGAPLRVEQQAYDAAGQLISRLVDVDADGFADQREELRY